MHLALVYLQRQVAYVCASVCVLCGWAYLLVQNNISCATRIYIIRIFGKKAPALVHSFYDTDVSNVYKLRAFNCKKFALEFTYCFHHKDVCYV